MTLYARLAVLAVILAALAGGAWKAYVMGKNTVKAEWDKVELIRTAEAFKLSEKNREKETALKLSQERISRDLIKEKSARAVADAAATDSLMRLRTAIANSGGPGQDTDTTCGTDVGGTERELLSQCAEVVRSMAATADRLSGKVSGLQRFIGALCVK
jgi:Tfp pilus assembly protein PilE